MNEKIRIGLIGVGYWGKNILRNIITSDNAEIACVCDNDLALAKKRLQSYNLESKIPIFSNLVEFFNCDNVDAVAIATPASTHYQLSKLALENNKHVLVEKPMCFTNSESNTLINLANKNNLTLMCDHTFCFAGPTMAVKEIIQSGELGKIISINSTRLNLGLFQKDTNVLWDLAPHDLSILQYVLEDFEVISQDTQIVKSPVSEHAAEAHVFLKLKSNVNVSIHNSWINPTKERKFTVIGDKKMLVWDDLSDDKIKLYNKNVTIKDEKINYYDEGYEVLNFNQTEPLLNMINHFVDCILTNSESIASGNKSQQIVSILSGIDG